MPINNYLKGIDSIWVIGWSWFQKIKSRFTCLYFRQKKKEKKEKRNTNHMSKDGPTIHMERERV